MKSKIAKLIFNETPQKVKDEVKIIADGMVEDYNRRKILKEKIKKPDFTKRSVKIACWINDVAVGQIMNILPLFIIIGAIAFTFAVDQLLELEKGMKSVTDEAVYIPILIFGFLISGFVAFLLLRVVNLITWLISRDYYKWYNQ